MRWGVAAAKSNDAQGIEVELIGDPAANTGDVQRGHWRWTDHTFTPNSSLATITLANVSTADLDANPDFINAVRVRVRRQTVPARSFLSKVMGFSDFQMQAEAIAYIGFSGTLLPGEVGQPIAICQQALLNADGYYSCNTGRMINSGGGDNHNTAAWSNYTQEPCETASTPTVRPYVGCSAGPAPELYLGGDMGTTGGEIQSVWDDFYDCWLASYDTDADGRPDTLYNLTLAVIDCPANNVGTCSEIVGGVNVNMVWMIRITETVDPDTKFDWVPLTMTGDAITDWTCPEGTDPDALSDAQFLACWYDFVDHFYLVNYQGVSIATLSPLSTLNKSMYFLPDCDVHIPTGATGGKNFGVLAKIPVLVN